MKFCCDAFAGLVGEAGRRGFSILAFDEDDFQYFLIQGRSAGPSAPSEVTGIVQTGLQYCPWCGKKLKRIIRRQLKEFKVLAREHDQYVLQIAGTTE